MTRIIMSSGLMAGAMTPLAHAGVWNAAGQASIGGGYDDNVRLSNSDAQAGQQLIADISATLAYQDDATSFQCTPRLLTVRYAVDKSLNRTEPSLVLQAKHSTETSETSVAVSGTQDTTLTSELGSTGFSDVNKRHRAGSLTLGHSWNAAERIVIGTQLGASVSRYVDAEFTGLVDYDYGSALVNASYNLTERSTFTLQASIGKLRVPDVPADDKTNLDVTLGYRVTIAPLWTAELSFGPSLIRTQGRADSGFVYSATINHNTALQNFNLSLSRDVTPNGLGLLSRKDQINFGFTHNLSERWITEWSAIWVRNKNVLPAGSLAQQAIQYADITGGLRWRMTPTWSVAASAGFARQRTGNEQSAANRKHVALNISWNGLPHALNW